MDMLVFNDSAGAIARSGLTADDLLRRLAERGVRAELAVDGPEPRTLDLLEQQRGKVIVAGGDGTIQPVLQQLGCRRDIRLGILPGGTANHLAMALGIPADLDAAMDNLAEGCVRRIDLGDVNGAVFSQAAGAGLHARMFREYAQYAGKSASNALRAVSSALSGWEPQPMRVDLDGRPQADVFTQVTAANTAEYGRSFTVAPEARVDDGLLDVLMIREISRLEIPQYALAMINGTVADLPAASVTRAANIVVTSLSGRPMDVHADAHPVGTTPAVIRVLPRCVEVLVPQGEQR